MMSQEANIRVVCRFRPQNDREQREGGTEVVSFDPDMTTVAMESRDYPGSFTFDRIFDWNTTQKQVFDYSARQIVDDVMNGYNGTIFAYGQTGSGKTFTMMGDLDNPSLKGLTPRLVESIFQTIFSAADNLEFTVKVSYMEIYMEKIRDLLNPSNDNLPIHEEKSRGVYVKGLLEVFVGSVEEVYEAMKRGQSSRVVASTDMNAESSRSHSIFVITVSQKNIADGCVKTGRLFLVDLAGSEKVGKTGATGQTLEEAKKINKSLTALGMVINALTDGKSSHIPYRDSKLTRILQESLGGNSRTTLIINASPSSFNESETLSTLRFGMRAKTIKCKAKINAELSPAELKNQLKKAKSEVVVLKQHIVVIEQELTQWRSGITVSEADRIKLGELTGASVIGLPIKPSATEAANPFLDDADLGDEVNLTSTLTASSSQSLAPASIGQPLNDDEREDFLKRENELSDQLAEKEHELQEKLDLIESLSAELTFLKNRDGELASENQKLITNLGEVKLQLEKISFESKEQQLNMDGLKDANASLVAEVERLNGDIQKIQEEMQLSGVTTRVPSSSTSPKQTSLNSSLRISMKQGAMEKKKQEKMAQMLAEYDAGSFVARQEQQLQDMMSKLEMMAISESELPSTKQAIEQQHRDLLMTRHRLQHSETTVEKLTDKFQDLQQDHAYMTKRNEDMEQRLKMLEREYDQLLEKSIAQSEQNASGQVAVDIREIRSRLESYYDTKRVSIENQMASLSAQLSRKDEEQARLSAAIQEYQEENSLLRTSMEALKRAAQMNSSVSPQTQELEEVRQTMAQQLSEFDAMKKKLMKDLQNRCERVVELEMQLDDMRQQHNTNLRDNNGKQQQQKMAFLERNLEQLTNVQKQLVEQNSTLKKDLVVADKKLCMRTERIQALEAMLEEQQARMDSQTQKYETQLSTMQTKLQELRSKQPDASSWLHSSRIAKPLRGGGGTGVVSGEFRENNEHDRASALPSIPTMPTTPLGSKRSSWYISLLKK